MATDFVSMYLNGMRNVCWLAGFLRKKDGRYFVQQNNNEEQMIPFEVDKNYPLPGEFSPVEVTAHIHGMRLDGEQQCVIKAISVKRPSIRAMPMMPVWLLGKKGKGEFNPFASLNEVKKEVLEKRKDGAENDPSEVEQQINELFALYKGRFDSRLGENSNKVFIAGFAGAARYIEPNEHQTNGYAEVYLHQFREPERAVPIRVYTKNVQNLLRHIKKGRPISIAGQMRMKVLPDDEGNVRHRSLHVRCDDIGAENVKSDFLGDVPDWWTDLFKEGMSDAAKAKAAALARIGAAPKESKPAAKETDTPSAREIVVGDL